MCWFNLALAIQSIAVNLSEIWKEVHFSHALLEHCSLEQAQRERLGEPYAISKHASKRHNG